MPSLCPDHAVPGLVASLLGSVDCNVRAMTELGYRAIAAPGSELSLALTGLLTLYVGMLGVRMMLGLMPLRIGEFTVAAFKIGLVLALATSWPSYQQLVFDTLFQGPAQLTQSLMKAITPAGSAVQGDPFAGLQAAFDEMQTSATFFMRIGPAVSSPLSGGIPFAAASLNLASYLMLFAMLGTILAARIVLGLLLALGPVFAAFLLLDSTRGMFEGWLRAALGFALVPLFVTLALVMQLILIGPYLPLLAEMRNSGQPNLPAATSVLVITCVCCLVCLAGLVGIFIVAMGFSLPRRASVSRSDTGPAALPAPAPQAPDWSNPRLGAVYAAAAALEQRDARLLREPDQNLALRFGRQRRDSGESYFLEAFRSQAQPRQTASSMRRDS